MDLQAPAPDIILLATEWQPRALLRAQLIEEGFDVLATNSWPVMRRWLRPGAKPSLVIVDLQGLPQPERVLNDLKLLMRPARVLVLTSIGNVTPHTIEAQGFQAAKRPIRIDTVVAIATRILRSQTDSDAGRDSAEQSNS
jgi:DNA-binding NtrC family response regulator